MTRSETTPLKLAIFDVDGTLVDSQGHILAAMTAAFEGEGMAPPDRPEVLAIVGLSLPQAIGRLVPDQPEARILRLVAGYKDAYSQVRAADSAASSPLYPGIQAVLDALFARDDLLVAVATGKSRRGLDHVLAMHGLTGRFVSEQVADHHPSKPHPAMLEAVLSETGVQARDAVMIGDTSFDMEMGHAAGCRTLAVSWGYHPTPVLEQCRPHGVAETVPALERHVLDLLELRA
ncbi:MAG: HAD-IA family hydrolase [Rhodobacteraceae bacterium]|nr:HAD-IA family hydrolase [Paracoccaceae bacterium]